MAFSAGSRDLGSSGSGVCFLALRRFMATALPWVAKKGTSLSGLESESREILNCLSRKDRFYSLSKVIVSFY